MFTSLGLMPLSLAVAGALAGFSVRMMFLLAGSATIIAAAALATRSSVREIS